jgi:predicted acetyltransferase
MLVPFLASPDPEAHAHWGPHIEVDRTWAAVDGDRFVGNACVFSRDVTVPGSDPATAAPTMPMSAISGVGVHPTHRRQGLLLRLMGAMLDDGVPRGEPIAGLIASESSIYGRFGFGWATTYAALTIEKAHARFTHPAPEVGLAICDKDEAAKRLPALFDRLRRTRPGQVSRNAAAWGDVWTDIQAERTPAASTGLFFAVGDDGYVSYRVADGWPSPEPTTLVVADLLGATPEVETGLWQFVLSIDLVQRIVARSRPPDEPLRWWLANPRALRTTGMGDFLWIRVLDVPAALMGRGYQAEGRLVLEVEPAPSWVDAKGEPGPDPAAGRWMLDAGPDGATCRAARRGEPTDLRLGAEELGAALLGGQELRPRAGARGVSEVRRGALAQADTLFAARPLPFSSTGF